MEKTLSDKQFNSNPDIVTRTAILQRALEIAVEPDSFEECADSCTGNGNCLECVITRAQAELEELSNNYRTRDLRWSFERLIAALWDVRIAANNLERSFGIKTIAADGARLRIQLKNGIKEVADALGLTCETSDHYILTEEFETERCKVVQMAKKNSTEFEGIADILE